MDAKYPTASTSMTTITSLTPASQADSIVLVHKPSSLNSSKTSTADDDGQKTVELKPASSSSKTSTADDGKKTVELKPASSSSKTSTADDDGQKTVELKPTLCSSKTSTADDGGQRTVELKPASGSSKTSTDDDGGQRTVDLKPASSSNQTTVSPPPVDLEKSPAPIMIGSDRKTTPVLRSHYDHQDRKDVMGLIPKTMTVWREVKAGDRLMVHALRRVYEPSFSWSADLEIVCHLPDGATPSVHKFEQFAVNHEHLLAGEQTYDVVQVKVDEMGGTNSIHTGPHVELTLHPSAGLSVTSGYKGSKQNVMGWIPETMPLWRQVTAGSTLVVTHFQSNPYSSSARKFPWWGVFEIVSHDNKVVCKFEDGFDVNRVEWLKGSRYTVLPRYTVLHVQVDEIGTTNSIHTEPHIELTLDAQSANIYETASSFNNHSTSNLITQSKVNEFCLPLVVLSIAAWLYWGPNATQ